MKKRKFIIDCDTGTDDAIALVAALGCEEIDIIGITSVNGNVPEEYVAHNNLNLLAYLGYDIPVLRGAFLPLIGSSNTAADKTIHGKQGLGTIELAEAEKDFDERIASQFIYEKAKEYDGELELLATGPMTNIAVSIIEHKDLIKYIKHIYFMGGSTNGGNVTGAAEYNIWVDPEAVHTVLHSGIPCTMTGLNVTNLAIMNETEEKKIRSYGTREGKLVADILHYQMHRDNLDYVGARMHDPSALAAALYPECMRSEKHYGDAETRGSYSRGFTYIDLKDKTENECNVEIVTEIDVDMFKEWLCEKIRIAGIKGSQIRGEG